MVAVDQSKAFDSVAHDFIEASLKYFGFGEYFCKLIKTIGTNRRACIILENGLQSGFFDLRKGTAQGDCPSPILYNMCAQILIFKIECDPIIPPIKPETSINNNELNGTVFEVDKIKNVTLKNESFADDASTFTKFMYEALGNLKQIL